MRLFTGIHVVHKSQSLFYSELDTFDPRKKGTVHEVEQLMSLLIYGVSLPRNIMDFSQVAGTVPVFRSLSRFIIVLNLFLYENSKSFSSCPEKSILDKCDRRTNIRAIQNKHCHLARICIFVIDKY